MEVEGANRESVLLRVYLDANMDKDFSILSKTEDVFLITDLEGHIVFVTPTCEDFTLFSMNNLLKMKLTDLFIQDFLNQAGTFFSKRDQEKLDNFDAQITRKSGDLMDVNVTSIPIFFEQEFLGSYLVMKDITEIKMRRRKKMGVENKIGDSRMKKE